MEIDWKNSDDRKEFEESIRIHQNRFKEWRTCQLLQWGFCLLFVNLVLIVSLYGSAAYILINEATDTKAKMETQMREEWIAQRQVEGGFGINNMFVAIILHFRRITVNSNYSKSDNGTNQTKMEEMPEFEYYDFENYFFRNYYIYCTLFCQGVTYIAFCCAHLGKTSK